MTLLSLILVLVVVGIVMYLINSYVPMQANIRKILNVAVVIFVIIWLLQALGIWSYIDVIRVR